ncbi:hypothetical protein Bamb_5799 [Burkholderia ambifaria AMMD]|uniref:Uncharacterized protein n=2 Tax=Burkholderia ambifaria TaxID=152480 RepID=Q0B3C7_BURCM|nr:hypothetical protein Bamb_5799 [Burkholderia ambifaria AMMD]
MCHARPRGATRLEAGSTGPSASQGDIEPARRQMPVMVRVFDRASGPGPAILAGSRTRRSRRISMTQYQSRGNKAPPRTKQPPMLPKLGTALNWVPPKESSITKTQQKKRTTSAQ